jgi:cell shape-determining protein MreC
MKTIFSDELQVQKKQYLFAIGCMFLLAFVEFLGILNGVRWGMEKVFTPILSFTAQITQTLETPYEMLVKNYQGYRHIQDLELRYAEALAQLGELEKLRTENQELRALIEQKNSPKTGAPTQIAPVISYGQPYIGKGKNDGVSEGSMILLGDTFIGRVGKVSFSQSEVILLSEQTSQPVLAKTESGISGIVVGNGKQVMFTEVPADKELHVGDRIVTVGQPGINEGSFVGKIRSLGSQAGSSTQIAVLDQIVSFYDNKIVEVRQE